MKRILAILLLVSLFSYGQITNTFEATGVVDNGVSSLAISLTISSGDDIAIITIGVRNNADVLTSVTDSQGTNWVEAHQYVGASATSYIFYTLDLSTTGSRTITVNLSQTDEIAINGAVFSGVDTVTPYKTPDLTGGFASGTASYGWIPANVGELFIFCSTVPDSPNTPTVGTGQNPLWVGQGGSPSGRISNYMTWEVATSTGSNNQSIAAVGSQYYVGARFNPFIPETNRRIFIIN